jgi:phosphatidate cytidylyltransferase
MIRRLISAAVFLPLLVLYILKLPPVYYAALLAIVSSLALAELYGMYRIKGAMRNTAIILGVIIISEIYITGDATRIIAVSVLVVTSLRLVIRKTPEAAMSDIAPVIFGLLYVPGLMGYQIFIVKQSPELIILLYSTVWSADAMALLIGLKFGRRKLYESMSPNKTVSGAVGSLAGGAAGAVIIKAILLDNMPFSTTLAIGSAIGAVTIVGDLVESMLKRNAGVKDSGSIIPGHGGILDKVDGSLFAGPVLYWMLLGLGIIR